MTKRKAIVNETLRLQARIDKSKKEIISIYEGLLKDGFITKADFIKLVKGS